MDYNRWIIFEDSSSDKHAYPISNVNAIVLTSSTNITVYVRRYVRSGTDGVVDDTITLTCAANTTEEILDTLIKKMSSTVTNVLNISSAMTNITTVAYTAGS